MNRDQAELLATAIDDRDTALRPLYRDIMDGFGALALNNVTVEGLRYDVETRGFNADLLAGFVDILPNVDQPDANSFAVYTAQEARQIQSSVVWGYRDPSKYAQAKIIPFYIIGSKSIDTERTPIFEEELPGDTEILLMQANGSHTYRLARTKAEDMRTLQEKQDALTATPYSDEQLRRMFDEESGQLKLSIFSRESSVFELPTDPSTCGDGSNLSYMLTQRAKHKFKPTERDDHDWYDTLTYGRVLRGGLHVRYWLRPEFRDFSFTDSALVEYEVIERMTDLAVKFGKKEELKQLLLSHTVEFVDPMDTLLEERTE